MNFSDHNIFAPDFCENRYEIYAGISRTSDVYFSKPSNCWVIQSFDAIESVLVDPRFSSRPYAEADPVLLGADGAHHAAHRQHIEQFYSNQSCWRIPVLRSLAQQVAERLVKRLQPQTEFDVIKEFVIPYNVTLGLYLSGLNEIGARWDVLECSDEQLETTIDNCAQLYFKWHNVDSELSRFIENDSSGFHEKFGGLVENLKHLDQKQWFGFLKTMFIAGSETPSSLIGSAFKLLASRPETFTQLNENSSLIRPFLYETLRYNSPAQLTLRVVAEQLSFQKQSFAEGDLVALMIGFAHRDGSRFSDPDKFDLERPRKPLLAFGKGMHECLGKHVALALAELAITSIIELLAGKEIVQFKHNVSPQVFALESMHLRAK